MGSHGEYVEGLLEDLCSFRVETLVLEQLDTAGPGPRGIAGTSSTGDVPPVDPDALMDGVAAMGIGFVEAIAPGVSGPEQDHANAVRDPEALRSLADRAEEMSRTVLLGGSRNGGPPTPSLDPEVAARTSASLRLVAAL